MKFYSDRLIHLLSFSALDLSSVTMWPVTFCPHHSSSPHSQADSRWRCGRRVSTVLCVHLRRCQPANCSGHGDCVDGRCQCQEGWQGAACDSLVCQPPTCGPHGVCTASKCGGGAPLQQVVENKWLDYKQDYFYFMGLCVCYITRMISGGIVLHYI